MNCCDDFGRCKQDRNCPVRVNPFPPPEPEFSQKGPTMNPNQWLLAAFILAIAIGICAIAAMYIASTREAKNALEYRTADGGILERDVQALQAQVPSPRQRVRAGTLNLSQVATQAVTAALRDMGRDETSANPYDSATLEHGHWEHHYKRVRGNATAAQREAEEAHVDVQGLAQTSLQ
jgi:hypothetical protein